MGEDINGIRNNSNGAKKKTNDPSALYPYISINSQSDEGMLRVLT